MKKNITALLLAAAMMLSLAACGAKKEEAPAVSEPAVSEPAASTEEPNVSVELPEVDPDVNVPAASTEGPEADVMPEVNAPGSEGPSEPVTPEVMPEVPAEPVTPEVPAAPEAPAAGAADLNAFYLSLVDTYGENFPANMNLCDMQEMLDSFYPGLSGLATKQMMIYQPMMGAVVCEIALVEVVNEGDVETVKGIFQKRIDDQVAGGAWYPESIEGWKSNSRVVANGNCVMLIAYSECDAVVDAFNGLF